MYEHNLNYNLNPVRNCSWTSFPQPGVSRGWLILLPSSWEEEFGRRNEEVPAWFPISSLKRRMCPQHRELGSAVGSLPQGRGSRICFLLLGLRGEVSDLGWSVWRPAVTAQLKHVLQVHGSQELRPTQHSRSAVKETSGCSSMMARSQKRKQVEIAFNKGSFSLDVRVGL